MSEPEGETTAGCDNQAETDAPISPPNDERLEEGEKEVVNVVEISCRQDEAVSIEPANGSSGSDSGDRNLNNNSDVGTNIEITDKELSNTAVVPTVGVYSGTGVNDNQNNAETSDNVRVTPGLIIDACSSDGISTDPSTNNGINNELSATDIAEHTRTSSEDFVDIPTEDLIKGKINSDSVTSSVDTVEITDRCLSDGSDVRNTSEVHENGISSVPDASESNQVGYSIKSMCNETWVHDKEASTQLPVFEGDNAEPQVEKASTRAEVNRSHAEVTQSTITEKPVIDRDTDTDIELSISEREMGNFLSLTREEKALIDNLISGNFTSTRKTLDGDDETPKVVSVSYDQKDPLDVQIRMPGGPPVNITKPETNDGETSLTIAAQHESVLTDSMFPAEKNVTEEDDPIVQCIDNDKIGAKQKYSELNDTDNCTDAHNAEQQDITSSNELSDQNKEPQQLKSEITEKVTRSDGKQPSGKVKTANDQSEIKSARKTEVPNDQKALCMNSIDKSRGGSQARDESPSGKGSYRKTRREDRGTASPKGSRKERIEIKRSPSSKRDKKDKEIVDNDSPCIESELSKIKNSKGVVSASELEAQWRQEDEEKRKKAVEEEKKATKEREMAEEERQKQDEVTRNQEEDVDPMIQEKKSIEDFVQDAKDRIEYKRHLRGRNLTAGENRPDEHFFTKLDSSLKKNTAFVKKLKNLTESQKDSLAKEYTGLNLTKYIGEVAGAITEAKLKLSDVSTGIHLCSLIHQRYVDFATALLDHWQKYFLTKKDEKISNPSKYRVDLRFFAELVSVGVFTNKEGLSVLANQLSILVNSDKDEHSNLSILSSFVKHCGDDYAGLIPRKCRQLIEKYGLEIERSKMLTPERQKACRYLLKDYYISLCKHLKQNHKELKQMEKHNRKILQTKGELSTERRETYESSLNLYQKLHANTTNFADLLDEDVPEFPEEESRQDDGMIFDLMNPLKSGEFQYEGDTTLFEDEDTRCFYETLPDLRALIPGILYKESEHSSGKNDEKNKDTALEEDDIKVEDVEKEMEIEQKVAEEELRNAAEEKAERKEKGKDEAKDEERMDESVLQHDVEEEDDTGSLMKTQFEAYILSLPNCVNRDLIDKAAVEFCMNFNTKSNRKKLVRGLFTVHRTRYDLLPFYSRLVGTLYPCMPDVCNDLMQLLKGDFKWHLKKKDQINIESKLKTVRFIGEMVKFQMFPKAEALHCVKMLMFDFSHHNIEMVCSLLESCGRFLYRSPDSHHRTKVYLDVMMRKKTALHLDNRYTAMVENAYFYSNPPEASTIFRKVRPPMHEYIRKLLYKDLSKVTTEKVLRQLRKLDWDDPEIAFYTTKCLTAVWNVRYNSVHCMASLLAGLAPYHETVAIQVVDGILEDVRIGMEINHPRYNQRRVSEVKYLGELYNFRMVESSVIFKTLYSFITFGVSMDEAAPSPLDIPDHLFRIRLASVILDTCGQYFDKGSSKKKLDCFLVYYQRYYWFKKAQAMWTADRPFPIDVDNLVQDTVEAVRPKLKLFSNKEEAEAAADELDQEYKAKLENILSAFKMAEDEQHGDADLSLHTIQESDEYGDNGDESLSQIRLDEGGSTLESETSQEDRFGSPDREDHFDESASENEDNVMESAGENEMEDQVTLLTGGPKHVTCTEDSDFMEAFDKMMTDNIQARNQESLKVPQLDIAVPMNFKGQKRNLGE